eukprot:9407613-Pyramimonas_sp.AAC.1
MAPLVVSQVPAGPSEATALLDLPVDADDVHQTSTSIQDLEVVDPHAVGRDHTENRPWFSKPFGIVPGSTSPSRPSKGPPQRDVLGYAGVFFYLSNALTGPGFFGFPKMLQADWCGFPAEHHNDMPVLPFYDSRESNGVSTCDR